MLFPTADRYTQYILWIGQHFILYQHGPIKEYLYMCTSRKNCTLPMALNELNLDFRWTTYTNTKGKRVHVRCSPIGDDLDKEYINGVSQEF